MAANPHLPSTSCIWVIGCVIAWLVPDTAEAVEVKMKCEQYLEGALVVE